tara:strand:- start:540 stop:1100 length:561 start_codon:yes stop_codon:yes gene_type:complete
MAANKKPGLNKFTVQEATNKLCQKHIFRTTPTIPSADYASGDVLFNSAEITNAVLDSGGKSKLVGCSVINTADQLWDFDLVFMQVATDLGTVDGALDITTGEIASAKILGIVKMDSSIYTTDLVNARFSTAIFGNNIGNPIPAVILEAAAESTSVYMGCIARAAQDTSGTGANTSNHLSIILDIEY